MHIRRTAPAIALLLLIALATTVPTAAQQTYYDSSNDAFNNIDIQGVTVWHDATYLYVDFGNIWINYDFQYYYGWWYYVLYSECDVIINGHLVQIRDSNPYGYDRVAYGGELYEWSAIRVPLSTFGGSSTFDISLQTHYKNVQKMWQGDYWYGYWVTVTDEEYFDSAGPFTYQVSSPEALLDEVVTTLAVMIGSGSLPANNADALIKKVDQAAQKLAKNNPEGAVGSLQAAINQLHAFMNAGKLGTDPGLQLVITLQSVIDMILNP